MFKWCLGGWLIIVYTTLNLQVADNNATGPLGCFTGRTRASAENILVRIVVFVDDSWHHFF